MASRDLTRDRYQAGRTRKEATPDAVRVTRNALIDHPLELVHVTGGATYAIPAEVINHLRAEAKAGRQF